MRILYLLSPSSVHSHDYGVDFLLHGLFSVLRFENVFDWPEKDSLHITEPKSVCDVCVDTEYDSDQAWPRKSINGQLADIMQLCDVAILATQPGDHSAMIYAKIFEHAWSRDKPIVAVDQSDSVAGATYNYSAAAHVQFYRAIAGRPLAAYFKRELPLGEQWAIPLPLSYPASRVPRPFPQKDAMVFYHAAQHSEQGPGLPRGQILTDLRARCRNIDVALHATGKDRLSPTEYHARMKRALIGVSWNGFPYIQNWDCSRFWEHFAYGICQVAEQPRIRIPHAPINGTHCVYVSSVDEVGPAVENLLGDSERTLAIAQAGHDHFLLYHTSEARARYTMDIVERVA